MREAASRSKRAPRQHRVHHRRRHAPRALGEQEVGGAEERAAGRDLVVDEQAALAGHVADHGAPPARCSSSPERRLSMIASGRSSSLANRPASLASPTSAATTTASSTPPCAQALAQHRDGGELIGRHGEEALDLRRVEIEREHAVGAGGGEQVGHEPRGDRDARLVLLVAARVREVGQHRGHPPRRGVGERVDQDQQLHDVLGQRRRRRLHHETSLLADVLLDLDLQVLVGEASGRDARPAGCPRHLQISCASAGCDDAGEDLEPVHRSPILVHRPTPVKAATATPDMATPSRGQ